MRLQRSANKLFFWTNILKSPILHSENNNWHWLNANSVDGCPLCIVDSISLLISVSKGQHFDAGGNIQLKQFRHWLFRDVPLDKKEIKFNIKYKVEENLYFVSSRTIGPNCRTTRSRRNWRPDTRDRKIDPARSGTWSYFHDIPKTNSILKYKSIYSIV